MSYFFRGKVWLRFLKDYAPYGGAIRFREGQIVPVDSVDAECLVACGYAVEYNSANRPDRGSETTMGAAS